jgi:hypothetical protein
LFEKRESNQGAWQRTTVGGGEMDVEHLHRSHLIEHSPSDLQAKLEHQLRLLQLTLYEEYRRRDN